MGDSSKSLEQPKSGLPNSTHVVCDSQWPTQCGSTSRRVTEWSSKWADRTMTARPHKPIQQLVHVIVGIHWLHLGCEPAISNVVMGKWHVPQPLLQKE